MRLRRLPAVMRRCRWVASHALATAPLAFSLLLPSGAFGQAVAPPRAITRDAQGHPTVRAFRVGEGIAVDGRLNERFYEAATPFDDLIQAVPVSRGAPSERTEVWIGFDDANLYVAARVWDSLGEAGWIANEMRRDSTQLRANDSFGIYFDTYHDRRNAVGFFVNPIGGFAEVQITNQATPNFDWNPVWDVATGRFDGGWTVEMAIPFKSLRYRPGVEQIWGVQIRRSVLRSNEWSYLTAVPIQVAGSGPNAVFRVSMYGDLVGIEAPPPGLNLEVKPFATSRISTDRVVVPAVENDWLADAGLDVKYAVTQNLALDLTVNTDFAQVEVDEQQVNLTRFNLLFPEKREFFLEGRGVYDFGIGRLGSSGPGGGGAGAAPTLFYSRRIGLLGSAPVQVLAGGRLDGESRRLRRRPAQHPDGGRRHDRRGLNELHRRPREAQRVRPEHCRSAVREPVGVNRSAGRVQQGVGCRRRLRIQRRGEPRHLLCAVAHSASRRERPELSGPVQLRCRPHRRHG